MYGLYAALFCAKKGESAVVLEYEDAPFTRATYINQARVHMGYHYPRSYSTAIKSAHYFNRFFEEFGFSIHTKFDQVYAMSENFSWSSAEQFTVFCKSAGIRCEELPVSRYFNPKMCDGAFLTEEYTYDARILRDFFLEELKKYPKIEFFYNARLQSIEKGDEGYVIAAPGQTFTASFVLNATYASVNQILALAGYEPFAIKYELCEIILCDAKAHLNDVGITVMDGPFFSIMPFGKTGFHSLTSVTFTPHKTSYDALPTFPCQETSGGHCSSAQFGNCDSCPAKPESAWPYMNSLSRKYLKPEYDFAYRSSLFSMKPILKASELDDSRPTVIRRHSQNPDFVSVLSGKINTVYDLDEVLQE
ncbi:hypothetical membrane protein [Leadbettera azotonutricia ZAS-9]|uniref:Hypothetical membrane protein n=1 Tax=Leadbettera azotonutricia (strain ATCC BAA-888 / DSM 13862 / ZAS-9) TaxID=545695 RepID=F5Y759_LEAAZ|nr:hypothetical membrane protein [Leadbettera azotonutricia ZAS-9]